MAKPRRRLEEIRRYADAGLGYLVISVAGDSTDVTVGAIDRFANEELPKV